MLQAGEQVGLDVRHVGLVELLDPAEPDHPGGHPVGEHDDVAADRLAAAELVLDLAEELVVVVDVVVVGDVDAGLRLELLEGGHRLALATSMYCGQLEKTSFFSFADMSVLLQVSAVCFWDSVPQAASRLGDPSGQRGQPGAPQHVAPSEGTPGEPAAGCSQQRVEGRLVSGDAHSSGSGERSWLRDMAEL